MKNQLFKILGLAACVAALSGCMKDNGQGVCPAGRDGEAFTLTIQVPGASTPVARSLGVPQESHIASDGLDVLVFEYKNSREEFAYLTHGTDINEVTNSEPGVYSSKKQFKVLLRKSPNGTEQYRFVILANLRGEIRTARGGDQGTLFDGKTKAEVLALVRFASASKWNTTGGTDFTPLPMWGETSALVPVTPGTTFGVIPMLRSVARVDVGLNVSGDLNNPVAAGFGDLFKITDVNVYYSNKAGYAAPLSANMGTGDDAGKAVLPTVAAAQADRNAAKLAYSFGTGTLGSFRDIYLAEADNKNASNPTCLVIAGYYTKPGDAVNTSVKTWYRLDFYQRATESQPANVKLDILRNHRYLFNISSVDGAGYPTEEEALNSTPINMDGGVLVWDEADIDEIAFNDQNYLAVTPREFNLPAYAGSVAADFRTFTVMTDVNNGWKIGQIVYSPAVAVGEEWLVLSETTGGNGRQTVTLGASKANTSGAERTATFYVSAGRLRLPMTVTQATRVNIFTFNGFFIDNVRQIYDGVTPIVLSSTSAYTVTAKANTNSLWGLYWGQHEEASPNFMADIPVDDQLSMTIDAIPWGTQTTTLTAKGYDNVPHTIVFTQTGYTITGTVNLSTIPALGGEAILTLSGNFPAMNYRAIAAAGNLISNVVAGDASVAGASSVTLKVGPNGTGATRNNIYYQYEKSPGVWESLYTTVAHTSNCRSTQPSVLLPLAPPGVIGVGAASGRLTLRGSQEFAGTDVAANSEFGPLADETVWAVYFKWGSLIAMYANNPATNETYDQIAWAPSGYDLAALKTAMRDAEPTETKSISLVRWEMIPYRTAAPWTPGDEAAGLGNPCTYADKGTAAGTYSLPTGKNWNGGGYTNGTSPDVSINAGGITVYGRYMNGNKSLFLSYAGYRGNAGATFGESYDTSGLYWNTFYDTTYGYSMYIQRGNSSANVNNANSQLFRATAAIRCVSQ